MPRCHIRACSDVGFRREPHRCVQCTIHGFCTLLGCMHRIHCHGSCQILLNSICRMQGASQLSQLSHASQPGVVSSAAVPATVTPVSAADNAADRA